MKPGLLLFGIVLICSLSAKGQSAADSTSKRTTIFGLPIVYYSPETRKTYGAALRFAVNKDDRINIRLDVGMGNGEPAYYLTVGEAF